MSPRSKKDNIDQGMYWVSGNIVPQNISNIADIAMVYAVIAELKKKANKLA